MSVYETIGRMIAAHYRSKAADTSIYAVAARLKKQGIPIELALRILVGRTT
jgi:hypothetical protein